MPAEPDPPPFATIQARACLEFESAGAAVPARATVHAGERVTDYVRAGSGATVLLLADRGDTLLMTVLAAHFRVIAPEVPVGSEGEGGLDIAPPAFTAWLGDFLDGLGVAHASVVARAPYSVGALHFCLTHPSRVDRLALMVHVPLDAMEEATRFDAAQRVLFIHGIADEDTAPDVRDDLLRFLSPAADAPVQGAPSNRDGA